MQGLGDNWAQGRDEGRVSTHSRRTPSALSSPYKARRGHARAEGWCLYGSSGLGQPSTLSSMGDTWGPCPYTATFSLGDAWGPCPYMATLQPGGHLGALVPVGGPVHHLG